MTLRPLRLAGGLAALAAGCLLLGFLAGWGPSVALDRGWLAPRTLDLVRAPTDQVERALLAARVDPDGLLPVEGSGFQFQSDDKASLVEVLAARGDSGLMRFMASYQQDLDAAQVGAGICAAARYGHGGPLAVLLQLRKADAASLRCNPEGLKPSSLAEANDHGSAAELLAEAGF